jgi:hypothetical protein
VKLPQKKVAVSKAWKYLPQNLKANQIQYDIVQIKKARTKILGENNNA